MVCHDVDAVSQGRWTPALQVIGMEVGLVVQISHVVKLDMSISYMVEDDFIRMESTVPPLRNTFVMSNTYKSMDLASSPLAGSPDRQPR